VLPEAAMRGVKFYFIIRNTRRRLKMKRYMAVIALIIGNCGAVEKVAQIFF